MHGPYNVKKFRRSFVCKKNGEGKELKEIGRAQGNKSVSLFNLDAVYFEVENACNGGLY
jgi:hypothetical protein